MSSQYWIGQAVSLTGVFTSDGGAPVDVTDVVFTLRKPDTSLVTVAATETSLQGYWTAQVVVDQAGEWRVKVASGGVSPGVDAGRFTVKPWPGT